MTRAGRPDVDENAPTVVNPRPRASIPGAAPVGAASPPSTGAFEAELSRYTLGEKLGSGGMAAVFRAVDQKTGDTVALKIIENNDDDKSRQARFEREVRAAGGLVHENVCRVLSFGRAPLKLFMAMELVEGATLQRMIKARGTLPVPLALEALRQLLLALECAHERGVVHRDLKPANVMVTPNGTLKLLDFGIAKSQEDETVTATGLLIGTPAFMAPEQILGAGIDARSDLFSAGVTFLVMLTGRTRFAGHEPASVMLKVTTDPVPSLLEECPAASTSVEKMLATLCAQTPEARFQSARAALDVLATLEEMPPPAEGKRLLARYLQAPDDVAASLAERSARAERARAERLLQMGPAAFPAAALSLHRAAMLMPDEDTRTELRDLCSAAALTFDPIDDPRITDAMAAFDKTPNNPGVLKRLADLYKARGHVLLAAAFLTRYLRVKPQDTVAAQALSVLIDGPSPPSGSLPPDARTGTGERLRTRDIVAGIKTGGQVSPALARSRPGAVMAPTNGDAATVQLPTAERAPPLTVQRAAPSSTPRTGQRAGPAFAGQQGVVATPSIIVASGADDRVRASIHPLYMVIGAILVAGLTIAFFGRFVRTTVDDVQLAINDNSKRIGQTEQNSVDRLRQNYLAEAKGHLERGNHAAAARQANLLLATNPPAELALEGIWLRALARLKLDDKMSARIDLEEYLKQSTLSDPHRPEAKRLLDEMYAAKALDAEPPAGLKLPELPVPGVPPSSSPPSSRPSFSNGLPPEPAATVGAQGLEPSEPKAPGAF